MAMGPRDRVTRSFLLARVLPHRRILDGASAILDVLGEDQQCLADFVERETFRVRTVHFFVGRRL